MGKNKIDMNDPALQFWQTDTIDRVYNPNTGRMYSVFHEDDGKGEVVDGGAIDSPNISYWSELTREEFKYLHPTVFQS